MIYEDRQAAAGCGRALFWPQAEVWSSTVCLWGEGGRLLSHGLGHELEGTLSQVSINYLGLTQVSHFSKKEVSGPSCQGLQPEATSSFSCVMRGI